MANITLPSLTSSTGIFPGATESAGVDVTLAYAGMSYKGIRGNYWQPEADGTAPAAVTNGGAGAVALDAAPATDGGGIELVRAINETLVDWQATAATGTNSLKYFGAKAGNYSIADQSALKRDYTTSLYYKLDNTIDSAGLEAS